MIESQGVHVENHKILAKIDPYNFILQGDLAKS